MIEVGVRRTGRVSVRRSTASWTPISHAAMMSINAVKGVEIGAGFDAAALSGEDNADEMRMTRQRFGAIFSPIRGRRAGGISPGRTSSSASPSSPLSSILTPRKTVTRQGRNTEISTKGRHDPCVGIRGVPVGEAMMACVLADHLLRHRGQLGKANVLST